MGRISPGPTRWPPGAERRLVPTKSNLKPQTSNLKILPKVFVARWRLLGNAPSKGHHSRYITLFFKGTYSVIGFYELMRMFLVSLMHFLR